MKNKSKKTSEKNSNNPDSLSYSKILDTISNNNPDKLIEILINHLKHNHNIKETEILAKLSKKSSGDSLLIPAKIFATKLSPAEALVKHLKEEYELGYRNIASLINRDERGIWSTYNRAKKKHPDKIEIKEAKILIPLSIFKNRKLSILENTVKFILDNYNLTKYQIAKLLNKKPQAIWAVFNRIQKKQ